MGVASFCPCAPEKAGGWIQVFGGEKESVETILLDVAICCPTQLQWEVNVYRNSLPKIKASPFLGGASQSILSKYIWKQLCDGIYGNVASKQSGPTWGQLLLYLTIYIFKIHGLLNSIESPVWEGHFYSKTQPGNPPRLLMFFFLRWAAICVILFHVHRKGNRKRKESKSNQQVFNNHMNEIICIINCHTKNLIRNNWKPVFSIPQDSH